MKQHEICERFRIVVTSHCAKKCVASIKISIYMLHSSGWVLEQGKDNNGQLAQQNLVLMACQQIANSEWHTK